MFFSRCLFWQCHCNTPRNSLDMKHYAVPVFRTARNIQYREQKETEQDFFTKLIYLYVWLYVLIQVCNHLKMNMMRIWRKTGISCAGTLSPCAPVQMGAAKTKQCVWTCWSVQYGSRCPQRWKNLCPWRTAKLSCTRSWTCWSKFEGSHALSKKLD